MFNSKKSIAALLVLIMMLGIVVGAWAVTSFYANSTVPSSTISSGSMINGSNYLFSTDGSNTYYAKNCSTGVVYESSNEVNCFTISFIYGYQKFQ